MAAAPGPFTVLRSHKESVNCISFLNIGNLLCSGSLDGSIKLWNLKTRRSFESLSAAHDGASILSVDMHPTEGVLVTSGRDGYVKTWSLNNSHLQHVTSLKTGSRHFCGACCDKNPLSMGSNYENSFVSYSLIYIFLYDNSCFLSDTLLCFMQYYSFEPISDSI